MTSKLAIVCVALGWTWLGGIATVARAQDPILTELYGSGVHEYFSGGYQQSIADLTQAIKGGSKDPRVYYFRALAWLRLNGTSNAEADFAAGAKMESADINQYYPVSKSLERVQGSGRLMLERYRVQARAEAYRRQEKRNLARYEAQRRAESEVLRATPPPPAPGDTTPAAKPAPAAGKPAEKPAAEKPPAEDADDPFADDATTDAAEMPDKADDAAAPETDAAADADSEDAADDMPAEDADESMEDMDAPVK
jgi:hypothetical protein